MVRCRMFELRQHVSGRGVCAVAKLNQRFHCARRPTSNTSHEHEYQHDQKHKAQSARRPITPFAAMSPAWKCPDKRQNQQDDQYGSEQLSPPFESPGCFSGFWPQAKLGAEGKNASRVL